MIVRVRFVSGPRVQHARGKNRQLAFATAALLVPVALMAYVMGLWRLASDMGFAREFAMRGLLSHWQIWMGIGVAVQIVSYALNRYARSGRMEVPRILTLFPVPPEDSSPKREARTR